MNIRSAPVSEGPSRPAKHPTQRAVADFGTLSGFESRVVRLAGTVLSGRRRRASLLVMMYHRVLAEPDPLRPGEPDAIAFEAQIELIAGDFNVLPLREAIDRLRSGTLPARAVSITFDDGYANNYEIAAPILAARRVPATIFVATGYLNGGRMFNDTVIEAIRSAPSGDFELQAQGLPSFRLTDDASRVHAASEIIARLKYLDPHERVERADSVAERVGVPLPSDLMMNDAQVERLARMGFEIGAHTVSHPILASVDEATAWTEIAQSRQRLEEIVGEPVRSFAYPNGTPLKDYSRAHVELVRKAGFDIAVSTEWGAATAQTDEFQIPRVAPWDMRAWRYAARMLRAYRQRRLTVA
jgi:peptidoglycan/xylan/chitin deacetylase (PgdA/CDA1 family)